MKYLATLILLWAGIVQSCQHATAAERLPHKTEIVVSGEGLRMTVKIEAKSFETLDDARRTILDKFSKTDALNDSINDETDQVQGESSGFQWVSKGFRWTGGE